MKKKKIKVTSSRIEDDERELLASIEKGEWKSVKDVSGESERLRQIARNTLNKTKNINLRMTERAIMLLKRKAAAKGLPYQTLAASVLYQYGAGTLKEKE